MTEMTLDAHEHRSERRFDILKNLITDEGRTMEKDHVKVENIFKGPSDAGGGGMAAVLPALLAGRHDGGLAGGLGGLAAGGLGGLVLGSLLNRGGLLGGGADDGSETRLQATIENTTLLNGLGDIKAAVALTAAQTENVIGAQTVALQSTLSNLALGQLTATSQVKDTVNQGTLLTLQATNVASDRAAASAAALAAQTAAGFNETQALINSINTQNISRELSDTKAALIEERSDHRLASAGITITNNNNATANALAAQSQQQQQLQAIIQLGAAVQNLANDVQVVRQGQTIFNSGTMAASGTQAAANTRVN